MKRLIGSGFDGRPSGFFFNTATAPGAAGGLPFDPALCTVKRPHRCDGKRLGCRVNEMDAAVWNGAAPQVWSWLMTEIRRLLPGVDVQFWKCWETQDRGLLHLHAIIWALGVSEVRMREVWAEALSTTYSVDGFQFAWGVQQSCDRIGSEHSVEEIMAMLDVDPPDAVEAHQEATRAAQTKFVRYGAKYCTKGGKRAVTVNRKTGEMRADGAGYRTWSASARWGMRMKRIRVEQRLWAADARAALATLGAAAAGGLDSDADFYAGTTSMAAVLDSAVDPLPV